MRAFKRELIKRAPFYFRGIAYKFDGNGLLMTGRRIIKSSVAEKLYIELKNNTSEIVSIHAMPSVFDYYEKGK